jgi:hypothetical protein
MNFVDDLISSSGRVPGVTPDGLHRGRAALDAAIAARAQQESPARRKAAAHWFSGLRGRAIIGVAGAAAVAAAAAAIALPSSPPHTAAKPLADSSAKPAGKAPAKPAGQTSASSPAPAGRAATPAVASPWRLVYSTNFRVNAPVGSFSGCKTSTGYTCSGLPKALRGQWWAYGDGWPDTATVRHLKVHGYYSPSTTVSIAGGMMNIRVWRGAGAGTVHSAAVMPKAALGKKYGKYVVTFRVPHPVLGYKSAFLLWAMKTPTDGTAHEIDFPEGGWGLPFKAFIHYPSHRPQFTTDGSFDSTWYTTVLEWSPHGVSFYLDGKLIGSVSGNVADVPMRWVLQNETEDNGTAGPPPNSSSTIQIKYVAYYSWVG